jgi:hypothetical protein
MYGPCLSNEYINGLDAFINFMKKDMVDNGRGFICCPCKHCKNEKKYHSDDVLRTRLIKHGFKEDYRCWNKHGEVGLNEAEMREDDVNEADILRLSDVDIMSRVDNIEEMVYNIERHADDDQYSNGELAKYKKMIEDSNKPLYDGTYVFPIGNKRAAHLIRARRPLGTHMFPIGNKRAMQLTKCASLI